MPDRATVANQVATSHHADPRPRITRSRTAGRVLAATITAASAIGCRLPAGSAHLLARAGGTAEWALRPRKRRILAENLAHAIDEPASSVAVRRAVRREIVNEAHRSADFLWGAGRPDRVRRDCRVDGLGRLRRALHRGRGAILVAPHLAGWEAVFPLVELIAPVRVAAVVEDDGRAWAVARIRTRAAVELIPASAPPRRVPAVLAAGGVVAILPDNVRPGMRTVQVRLLGARILLPAGAGWMARVAQAPVVTASVLPLAPRSWVVEIGPVLDPPPPRSGRAGEAALMQAVADVWTPLLRAHPTQWAAVEPLPWLGPVRDSQAPPRRAGGEAR